MKKKILTLVILAGSTIALSGCLIASSNSTYETGRRVTDNTKSQVHIGHTSDDWLVATLGEPTERSKVEGQDNVEIWRYSYNKREESGGTVFLLFAGSSSKTISTTTYFELTDGVVTRYWSE